MLNKIIDIVRAGLPESAPPQAVAALSHPQSPMVLGNRWEGRVVYALFAPRGRTPAVVIKSDTNPAHKPRLYQEHETLSRLSSNPAMAGLVPAPLGVHEYGDTVVMSQSALPGTPLHVVLRQRFRQSRRRSAQDHARFQSWLSMFHSSASEETVAVEPETVLERLAQTLPAEAPGAGELSRWMAEAGSDLGALSVPVRPLHGDMGPTNCLIHRGRMMVVDWEGEVAQGPPLAEVLLFLSYYSRAIPGPGSRLLTPIEGFRKAFVEQGWLQELTWSTWSSTLHDLGLPEETAEYLFVATLADLASGQAPIAHANRGKTQRNWSDMLACYAAHRRSRSPEAVGLPAATR